MWTYIARRLLLMIPTLFGVTLVSFAVMWAAPGDPVRGQMSTQGTATASVRESYLAQKRDLQLDKPPLLNFRYFMNYGPDMRVAAHFMGSTPSEIRAELDRLAASSGEPSDPTLALHLEFLRDNYRSLMHIQDFDKRLAAETTRAQLVQTVPLVAQIYCENAGWYGVPPLVEILRSSESPSSLRIGAIRSLPHMVPDPFMYTYSLPPSESETPSVQAAWRTWWQRNKGEFTKLEPDQQSKLERALASLGAETSYAKIAKRLKDFSREDMPFFVSRLLAKDVPLAERAVAAQVLLTHIGKPLRIDVSLDATDEQIRETTDNWLATLEARRNHFEPSTGAKLWAVVADTQYAHLVWRLVTFDFGRSAVKTREPVGPRIWEAVKVSAPLMVLAQLIIYLVAVPLGIVCAVHRGRFLDRSISFVLFLLYSIPPFVAAMLMLLFLCYGEFVKWFPMQGLHTYGSDRWSWSRWTGDYLWHAFLPVVCLSLFSLAAMAMYSRSAMLDVIGQDFIRTARAKGVPERRVIWRHALRNALIPIITLFANFLPAMLGGSVLIEVIFGIPGMGRLSFDSIYQKDYPMLMALIYIDAIVVMFSMLLSDLLYVVADPRISFGTQGSST